MVPFSIQGRLRQGKEGDKFCFCRSADWGLDLQFGLIAMHQWKLELLNSPRKQHYEFGGTPEGEGPVLPENDAHTERDNKSN